jgi:hypothetical protein
MILGRVGGFGCDAGHGQRTQRSQHFSTFHDVFLFCV